MSTGLACSKQNTAIEFMIWGWGYRACRHDRDEGIPLQRVARLCASTCDCSAQGRNKTLLG